MAGSFDLLSPFKYFNVAPVTDWERFINPQFNITFNQGDARTENLVLARAGSYGLQLGRMQAVLDVLIAHLPQAGLAPAESRCLDEYRRMRDEVVAAVESARPDSGGAANSEDVNGLLKRLGVLRDNDPAQFERLCARIEQFLASTATPVATANGRGGRAPAKRDRG
jgi:hypothetical protein